MTAQIEDTFVLRNVEYSLAGISAGELLDVFSLGLEPSATCTACWRGYQAVFALLENRLVLAFLGVNLGTWEGQSFKPSEGPPIGGRKPTVPAEQGFFNNVYENLDLPLRYTGGVLLGKGFIQSLYVHMGFAPAWKYRTVIELIFEDGDLQKERDLSNRVAEIRKRIRELKPKERAATMPARKEIEEFVEQAFDRRYPMNTLGGLP